MGKKHAKCLHNCLGISKGCAFFMSLLLQLFSVAFITLTAYLIISPEKISLKKGNEANLGHRLQFRCLLSILQSKAPLSISVPTVQIHGFQIN